MGPLVVVDEAPATVRSRLRMVAATVSCAVGWGAAEAGGPAGEVCARTLQASQAPLAKNRPEGQRLSPEPS